jgi:hypothetical protein
MPEKALAGLWQENSSTECPKTEKALAGLWQGFGMKTEKTLAGKLGHSVPDSREGFDRALAEKQRRLWQHGSPDNLGTHSADERVAVAFHKVVRRKLRKCVCLASALCVPRAQLGDIHRKRSHWRTN